MSDIDNVTGVGGNEIHEPLLPVEKKLIGWSLGTGVVLLVILVVLNHLIPVQL